MKIESNIDKREQEIEKLKKYKHGFITDIENTRAPKIIPAPTPGPAIAMIQRPAPVSFAAMTTLSMVTL